MSDEKDVFSALEEFYNERVAEADTKGFAERYLAAAKKLIQTLAEEHFHVENEEYLDGYFLFGKGTNSIFHFTLKECPGWSFGVWWKQPENENEGVLGEWFAQYTETIDKFKPSASNIVCDIHVSEKYGVDYQLLDNIRFIRDEPYLAFCRDYCYWDLNTEYHTREEAQQIYEQYISRRDLDAEYQAKYDRFCYDEMVKTIKMNLDPDETLYLCDYGEGVSPRYLFVVYSPKEELAHDCDLEDLEEGGQECKDRMYAFYDTIRQTVDVYIDTWNYSPCIHVTPFEPNSEFLNCKKVD